MIFKPWYRFESGCAAYLLGCAGRGCCAVVDAHEADVDAYLDFAAARGMRITHVIDTHVHADHRSGGAQLARRAGAVYALHASADVEGDFEALADGQVVDVGNVRITVIHTPGHTPESVCLLVADLRRGDDPWFVLTGDTLFVGAVGRPDLPGDARAHADALYDSLHGRILTLPDALEVYPGHFAGSLCGAGMSGKPSSTLGFERRWNPLLSMDRAAFLDAVANVPPKPAAMEHTLRVNRGRAESIR